MHAAGPGGSIHNIEFGKDFSVYANGQAAVDNPGEAANFVLQRLDLLQDSSGLTADQIIELFPLRFDTAPFSGRIVSCPVHGVRLSDAHRMLTLRQQQPATAFEMLAYLGVRQPWPEECFNVIAVGDHGRVGLQHVSLCFYKDTTRHFSLIPWNMQTGSHAQFLIVTR